MSKLVRVVVLATALMSALGAVASSAGAVSWDNSGDTAFTATSGGVTFSSTGIALSCSASSSTGTVPATTVGLVLSFAATLSYSGCRLSNIATSIECGQTYTLTAQHGTGAVTGSVDMTCRMTQFGSELCHFEGAMPITYSNVAGVNAFTTPTSSSMVVTNGPVSTCWLGNGDPLHFTPQAWTMTSGSGPHLTRTV